MTYYVIKRTDQGGGYVAPPGSKHSYTQDISKARFFKSKEFAQSLCCSNEVVMPVSMNDMIYIT